MILNSGLDAACSGSAAAGSGTAPNEAWPVMCRWLQYAAFGTGSAAPDPTDTALGAQVGSRTNSRGGFSNEFNAGRDDTNDLIWCEATFTRVFSIASNVNATEWGLSAASTGNLSVRELFRADPLDNGSSPITLTLEGGDELQLVVTLRVQADWEYASKSFVITGTAGNDTNGTHDVDGAITSGASATAADITAALASAWPGGGRTAGKAGCVMSDQSAVTITSNISAPPSGEHATPAANAYTPGNYYRDWVFSFGTSAANGDIYAVLVADTEKALPSAAEWNGSVRFILTDPAQLTKASTHKLTLTVRKSIARL